ncbi:MAG: membrane protein insertion efficiency factor YidD [Gemmatimonadetes bacterium]|nr:membrane protein insertion efficiency factor YidD [Gemmatimonadota bacterium]MYG84762.1 membrane protein insertion efficiency factor YidD [Gemmatimonadota bacterium]MYJ89231.1 membrane protein insertion efficiency factor YidD [Gemmatimonadota bacterium]
MWKRLTRTITTTLVWGVRGYRLAVSPLLPPSCRFTPTCSNYAIEALERKGLFTGIRMAAWRLLRCHPFHPGGYDPVERPAGPVGSPGPDSRAGRVESGGPAEQGGRQDQPHPTA